MYSTLFIFLIIYARSNAMVQLQDFFPYGPNNSDTSMYDVNNGGLDDGSSSSIRISHAFQFFNHSYDSLWVNINGGVSFNSPISQYTPTCSPLSTSSSMISPFWADVDLRAQRGYIYFRQTTDAIVLNKALKDVKTAFPNIENLAPLQWAFVATWLNVPFFDDTKCSSNKNNTFQLALVTNGAYSFAIFMYNQIQWTTGTASGALDCSGLGGTPARAGFDNGEGQMYIIPESCNQTILNLASDTPGKYVFQVNKAEIILPGSSTLQVITNPVTLPTVVNTTTQSPPPSTTESLEKQLFKLHYQRLTNRLNELNNTLMKVCMKIVDRPALEKECFLDMEKLANLKYELGKTTTMYELTKVESEVDSLELSIKHIDTLSTVVSTTTHSPPPSTTESSLDMQIYKLRFQNLKDHINELKKRLMGNCMKIVDRPALQKECFLDLEKLYNLEYEQLTKTTTMDELIHVETEVDNLELTIKQIEKDIGYLFLI